MKLSYADLYLRTLQTEDEVLHQGFVTRKGLAPWPVSHPINWAADPYKEMNWRYCLHALRMCDPVIAGWLTEPARWRIDYVMEVFRSWAAYEAEMSKSRPLEDQIVRGDRHGIIWHDMGTSIRALKLAFLLDAADAANLSADDRAFLKQQADLHYRHICDPVQLSTSNHGLFQVAALETLAFVAPDAEWADAARCTAAEHLARLLKSQFTEEGIHREHSVAYHFFALKQINRFKSFKRLGNGDWKQRLTQATRNSAWLRRPDGSVVMVGDTMPSGKNRHQPRLDGERHGDFISSTFHKSGYAIARTVPETPPERGGMIFLTGMRWSKSHKNDDDLSFEWFDHGEPIIVDAGKFGYQNHKFRRYAKRQVAHSTVGIVENDTNYRHLPLYGSALNPVTFADGCFVFPGQSITTNFVRPVS